jgi:hypothetical protein
MRESAALAFGGLIFDLPGAGYSGMLFRVMAVGKK